jgi:hypothetical protein
MPRGRGGSTTSGVEALALEKKLVRGATPTRGASLSEGRSDQAGSPSPYSIGKADWVGFGNRAVECWTTGGGGLPLFDAKNEPIERVATVEGGSAANGADNDDDESELPTSLLDAGAAAAGMSPPRSALEARPIMANALLAGGATNNGWAAVGEPSRMRFLVPVGDSGPSELLDSIQTQMW